jgi:hypothetical protein
MVVKRRSEAAIARGQVTGYLYVKVAQRVVSRSALTDTRANPVGDAFATFEDLWLQVIPRSGVVRKAAGNALPVLRIKEVKVIFYGLSDRKFIKCNGSGHHGKTSVCGSGNRDGSGF